ncbi:MAG: helix-turn-helix transcriptional regulator [Lachnospiraceae bacterium]|nr:helix-turn-helix transcriptional regulator [Lachnospiraceae bacterium]
MKKESSLPTKDTTSLGSKVVALRKQRNVCQKALASYLHVSISTISNYENDVHEPDLPTLVKLADYFDVSIDYLLNRTEYAYPISSLDTQLISNYTFASIMNTALQLSTTSQTDLVNYLAMLNMRDKLPTPLTLDTEVKK